MENYKKIGWSLIIPIVLTLLTVVLGYISFDTVFPGYPFSRKLYYSFQLFSMESGDRFYETGITYCLVTRIIYNTARFLAIFTLIYTIVLAFLSVIKERFYFSRVKKMRRHTILCGLGELGNAIAGNFEPKKKLVIIEKNSDNENLEQLRKQGVKIVCGNALDPEVLKRVGIKHADYLYALTGDDFDNLTILRNAMTIMNSLTSENNDLKIAGNIDSLNLKKTAYYEMSGFSGDQKCELRKLLDSFREKAMSINSQMNNIDIPDILLGDFQRVKTELLTYNHTDNINVTDIYSKVKLFNVNELGARYIFRLYPPDRFFPVTNEKAPPVHVLLIGYSQMGEEFFKLCVQNCHYINRKNTRITILLQDTDPVANKILTKHKNITKLIDLKFVKLNPHHLTPANLVENSLTDVNVIYICSEQDRSQASYTRTAREVFARDVPIVRWFSKNLVLGTSHKDSSNIYTVEILKSVSTSQNIIDEAIDYKAIAIHNRWLKRAISGFVNSVENSMSEKREIPLPKSTLQPWHLLDEEIRDDNRSVVEHNLLKIRSVVQITDSGFFVNPEASIIDFGFLSDDTIVRQLAGMEHRRWMANKYFKAWEYNPVRNDIKKLHNDLKDFDELDPDIQEYDINQVKELKEEVFHFYKIITHATTN